jgi:CRP-like cAMP-binding protein
VDRSPNRILASVSDDVFAALSRHMGIVEFKHGTVLAENGEQIKGVYFPIRALFPSSSSSAAERWSKPP